MIFMQWFCILMSQNGGKNIAFKCCSKMVGLLQPPKTPKVALTSQNATQIHQDSPTDTSRHQQTASDTIE